MNFVFKRMWIGCLLHGINYALCTLMFQKNNPRGETFKHVRKCTWNFFWCPAVRNGYNSSGFPQVIPEGELYHTSLSNVSLCARQSDCYFGKDTPCFWLIVCLVLCICPAGMWFPWFLVAMVCLCVFTVCFRLVNLVSVRMNNWHLVCLCIIALLSISVYISVYLSVSLKLSIH